jgi:hypothetical protein
MLSVMGLNGATASGNPFGAVVTVVVAPALPLLRPLAVRWRLPPIRNAAVGAIDAE